MAAEQLSTQSILDARGLQRPRWLELEDTRYSRRKIAGAVMPAAFLLLTVISVLILFIIFGYFIVQGIGGLSLDFFTQIPKPIGTSGGGIVQAILGSLEMLFVAAIVAIPLGLAVAICLAEYGHSQFVDAVRFVIELLAELPSIVVGVVVWAVIVRYVTGFSGLAGSVALALIMVPIIARSVEEILRLVPDTLREAALALGVPRWKVITSIVIPTVLPGILSGVVLSVARAAGETAPLLLTALGNQFINTDLRQPMAAIPLQIYNYALAPYADWHQKAWAATLVLIVVVALFSAGVRFFTRRLRYVF